jgi:hypothetical protein
VLSFARAADADFCSGVCWLIRVVGFGPDPHVPVSLSSS